MTYKDYKRQFPTNGYPSTVTGRIKNKKATSAVEFIENSAKSAKIAVNQVKTAKWDSKESKFGKYKTTEEHLEELRGHVVPRTEEEKLATLKRTYTDSTPDPNAAFRRMKEAESYGSVDSNISNKEDILAMAREMLEEMHEDMDEEYDEELDHDLWAEENDF